MSIGWSVINPVIKDVITECVLDTMKPAGKFAAEWHEGPRKFTSDTQKLSLVMKVTRVAGIGEDETRQTVTTVGEGDAAVTTVTETQTGQRKITLQLQAIVPQRTDLSWAMASLERIRMRLGRPRVLERLLEVDVSVIEKRDAVKATFKDQGHVVSGGLMEVVLGATASEDDPVPAGWIQHVVISSHLLDLDDTELPPAQQMVNVEVPPIP